MQLLILSFFNINPLHQFAKRLAYKGLKATIPATHYTVKFICATEVGVEPISDGFDEGGFDHSPSADAYIKQFKAAGSRTLAELIQKFERSSSPVTCVVYGSLARQYGIYGAPFFTNSATVSSIFFGIHQGLLTLPVRVEDTPLSMPGLPTLGYSDLLSFLKSLEAYSSYLVMVLSQFSNLEIADWIFGNSFDELEPQAAEGVSGLWQGKFIGPMIPPAHLDGKIEGDRGYGASPWKPLDNECMKWLETKPANSVVYVSFGSMVPLMPKQMKEIAWGLKGSGWHFLWVVRESERHKLPNGFIDTIEETGLVVTLCQQPEVLAQKAVGCFVTHCGWNSTLEGLSLVVPMVGVPMWADQFTNAKFIEDVWGVGVRAKEDEKAIVGREDLQLCVREVMEGKRKQEIRKNAGKWRELSMKAVSKGGSLDKNINDFVRYLLNGKKRAEVGGMNCRG